MKKLTRILTIVLALGLLISAIACTAKPSPAATGAAPPAEAAPAPAAPEEAAAPAAADDTVYNLVFTVHSGAATSYAAALNEWAADLKEKSNGRLVIDIYYGGTIAAAADSVEFVQQGGADITWNTVSLNASKFKYINVMSLYSDKLTNAPMATYVYKNLYKQSPAIASEFEQLGLRVLGMHCVTPSLLAGVGEKIETVEDFKGVSIMSISKACISVLDAFGAAVIGATPADLYENYAKNVVSASLLDGSLYVSTKLDEQIKYINTLNYNTALCFIVMNQEKFDSLPADLQELLDAGFDSVSETCALYGNEEFQHFVGSTIAERGIDIYDASPEVIAAVKAEYDIVIKEPWEKDCAAGGVDSAELSALVEKLIGEARALYGEEYDWFK